MKIEINNRFTDALILSGEYESVKRCLESNRRADLREANLAGANLAGANLHAANLQGAYLQGAYLHGADLREANLAGANLAGAYLHGAYLHGAYLHGAYLQGAYLQGAKGYTHSHDIFQEAVRRQPVSLFVEGEWVAIAQITIHALCWGTITKRFADVMPSIFTKLAKAGFGEWLKYWNEREGVKYG